MTYTIPNPDNVLPLDAENRGLIPLEDACVNYDIFTDQLTRISAIDKVIKKIESSVCKPYEGSRMQGIMRNRVYTPLYLNIQKCFTPSIDKKIKEQVISMAKSVVRQHQQTSIIEANFHVSMFLDLAEININKSCDSFRFKFKETLRHRSNKVFSSPWSYFKHTVKLVTPPIISNIGAGLLSGIADLFREAHRKRKQEFYIGGNQQIYDSEADKDFGFSKQRWMAEDLPTLSRNIQDNLRTLQRSTELVIERITQYENKKENSSFSSKDNKYRELEEVLAAYYRSKHVLLKLKDNVNALNTILSDLRNHIDSLEDVLWETRLGIKEAMMQNMMADMLNDIYMSELEKYSRRESQASFLSDS